MKRLLPRFLFQSLRNTRLSKSAASTLVLSRRLASLSWCLSSWSLPWLFGGWSFCDWKTGCSPDMSRLKLNSVSGFKCITASVMPRTLSVHCHRDPPRSFFLSILKCESLESLHCEEKGVAMDWPASTPAPKLTRLGSSNGGAWQVVPQSYRACSYCWPVMSSAQCLTQTGTLWTNLMDYFPVFYSHFCGMGSVV